MMLLACGPVARESASDCAAGTFVYRFRPDKKGETGVKMIFVVIVRQHTPYQGAGDTR
jgi:hypothetical protein